jgi:mannitol-1-phosphate 5-dehydrogenase
MSEKSAVIFGAGKTGRGFIAHLLTLSGYRITFVEKSPALARMLTERGRYGICVMGAPEKDAVIEGFQAVATGDRARVAEVVAQAHVVFVSVGGTNLPEVAPLVAEGLRARIARGSSRPLNIILCENYFQPGQWMRGLISEHLSDAEREWFGINAGIVEAIVLRSTVDPPAESKGSDPLLLHTQNAWELPADKAAFVGEIPDVSGLSPRENFQGGLVRKLYTYNSVNAVITYVGYLKGHRLLADAANDPEIASLAHDAAGEANQALCVRFGFDPEDQRRFAAPAIAKFQNREIVDSIERNARDPIRKLGRNDRLVGPASLALEAGVRPEALSVGIAAALRYDHSGDESARKLQRMVSEAGPAAVLREVSGIEPGSELGQMVLKAWEKLGRRTAVIVGAGKIARGFIAHLLALSGYRITFIEKLPALVDLLRSRGRYGVRIMGAPAKDVVIRGFETIRADEEERVARAIAEAGVVFVSVGARNLPETAPLLAAGLRAACARGRTVPLNILICENFYQPARLLRSLVSEQLGASERDWFTNHVGLVETMVLRSAIEPTDEMKAEDPLSVKSQDYWELPADKEAFVGPSLEISGLILKENFQGGLTRKLYTYNSVNAAIAYAGYLKGYTLLSDAANDPEIARLAGQVLEESGEALCRRYGFDREEQRLFAASALAKYQKREIVDPIERCARDPIRKLGANDRLVGPACLAASEGVLPVALSRAIASALHYDCEGDGSARRLQELIAGDGLEEVLRTVCGIEPETELARMVVRAHGEMRKQPRPQSESGPDR